MPSPSDVSATTYNEAAYIDGVAQDYTAAEFLRGIDGSGWFTLH